MNINDYADLFREAFEPLRARLNRQAERIRQGQDPQHNLFSPWLICTGKGGTQKREYLDYPDISLYRHCMDVATIASMLFIYAWQASRLASLSPEDETGARKALHILLAIAFLHDADKYRDQDGGWSKSQSPELFHIQKVYDVLEVDQWTELSVQDCFALVSRVETNRGKKNALLTPPPQDRMTDMLAAMVAEGDKLASIASRPEQAGGKGSAALPGEGRGYTMPTIVRRLVDVYNDDKRLQALVAQYAVPNERLRLLEFRHAPVVLHRLRAAFLEALFYEERLPLVCLLNGEQFSIAVPECFDLTQVFVYLASKLAITTPGIKRNHTNGELSLLHIHDVDTLIKVATDSYEPRILTIHTNDWDGVIEYIRGWVGAVGGLAVSERSQTGKLVMPVNIHTAAGADDVLPERYAYALAIACALRSDATGKLFEERLQRLQNWQDGKIQRGLQDALPEVSADKLDKNTRQTLYAMQAAMEIQSSTALYTLVTHIHESFPPPQVDRGTQAIVDSLKTQCGLAVGNYDPDECAYAPSPQGGTCLLTGAPAMQPIKASSMTLAGIKTSAFNNRMGHHKSLWSQADKNYLSEAAIKQQALLCETLIAANRSTTGQPLLVAMPFRGVFKPLQDAVERGVYVINSFMAVNEKDAGWKQVLPWNLDASETMPLMLETVEMDFDSRLHTMYRMAMLALYSGDPVHVFISRQRDIRAAFAFEHTPPLLQTLLRDLTEPDDTPGAVRRDKLPDLVQRLRLFRQIIATPYGHDVLSALPIYGWWAVAWFHARLIQDEKFFFASEVTIARKVYLMEPDTQLERIAALATDVQRDPRRGASNSDRTFALNTVLAPFATGKQYGQSDAATVAAMAETLEQALYRRDMHSSGEGPLAERCHVFAQEVYDFMTKNTNQRRFDARFHRFMLSAYAFLFMAKHGGTSNQAEVA